MRKKFFLTSAAVLLAVATLQSAQAATDVQKVIDETYVQPEYVLGHFSDIFRSFNLHFKWRFFT